MGNRLWRIIRIALIPLLCLAVGFGIGALLEKTESEPLPEQKEVWPEGIVMRCGDWSMDRAEFAYYFWSEYSAYRNSDAADQPDDTLPLSEQHYDSQTTWQDFFIARTIESVQHTMALVFRAQEVGHETAPAYVQQLETAYERFSEYAYAGGFRTKTGEADLDAYLKSSYGAAAEEESFFDYLTNVTYAASYADAIYAVYAPEESEVEAYFKARAGQYDAHWDDPAAVTLCVIDFLEVQEAERALQEFLATDRTEEDIFALAERLDCSCRRIENTIAPDIHVPEWGLDPARAPGDTAVLTAEAGAQLVLFVSREAYNAAYALALEDMRYENYRSIYAALPEEYPFQVSVEEIILSPIGAEG